MTGKVLAVGLAALMAPAARAAEIPQGAHVLLRMVNSVSTRTARVGDYVYLRTASPIAAEGRVIVPVGSYVQGVVSHAVRSGRVKGRAELALRLETLTLPGGTVLRFSSRLASADAAGDQAVRENTIRQGPDHGRDAARIAILAGTGASIGGIADRGWGGAGAGAAVGGAVGLAGVLLSRGREVELRQGSTLDIVLERPVTIE